ncbi:hypothetical protein WJX79_004208 [Trebouxia sp. C0005]|nr:MAG: iron-sulfur cluster assembly 2 mitochondrial-like [Trebouxia sp. A1-2]
MREIQRSWALALRALAASSNLPASRPLLATSFDSYRNALIIAASHLHGDTSPQSISTSLRSRSFSQAAVAEQAQPDIQLTEAASERIQELSKKDPNMVLRLRVDAGGCSGFSYKFDLETDPASDDIVVQQHGVQLVTDAVSYELLKGATVDYTTDLIRASFEVTQNPNASGKCGCGASFEPKI